MRKLKKGIVQVYTGQGKGKTTAAFGLALRAVGAGLKVYIIQFLKSGTKGEKEVFARLGPKIELKSFGRAGFVTKRMAKGEEIEEDRKLVREAFSYAEEVMLREDTDVVILDEFTWALNLGFLSWPEVEAFLKKRPEKVEVVITGRDAPPELVISADLVSEMLEIKHPYHEGLIARAGIEY